MRLRSGGVPLVVASLLSLLAVSACNNNGPGRVGVVPSMDNPLSGDWNVRSTISADGCNLGPGVGPISGSFVISGHGPSFVIGSVCCGIPLGTGNTEGSVVTIQSDRTVISSAACSWRIDELDAGTVDELGFSGGASLTVTAVGDCGPGFPCQIHGDFSATRCPDVGCGVVCPLFVCPDR